MKILILTALLFGWCPDKPAELSCKTQALHNYYEAQYQKRFFKMNEQDFTDTGVGCIDDCLEPMEGE